MSIKYIEIDSFDEDNGSYKTTDIKTFQNICKTTDKAVYEVLDQRYRRMYIDIDHIPKDDHNIVTFLIFKLVEFFELPKFTTVYLTINNNSKHDYLSYHLYFDYKVEYKNMRYAIQQFYIKYPEYRKYIDVYVYKAEQLMRPPLVKAATRVYVKDDYVDSDNRHLLYNSAPFDKCIIQNIENLPLYDKQFNDISDEEAFEYNIEKKYNYMTNGNRIIKDI